MLFVVVRHRRSAAGSPTSSGVCSSASLAERLAPPDINTRAAAPAFVAAATCNGVGPSIATPDSSRARTSAPSFSLAARCRGMWSVTGFSPVDVAARPQGPSIYRCTKRRLDALQHTRPAMGVPKPAVFRSARARATRATRRWPGERSQAWAARSILLAAVWRSYRPGTKHDTMVVLVGPQGIGKSTAFAWLFPPTTRSLWFSDALSLTSSEKVRVEALQGRVLVEASEMMGSTRADLSRLKAFLSRADDGATRRAYRRNPEPHPRRVVIVGSTNQPDCLPNDPSGNRRFVPIALTTGNVDHVRSYLDEHRGQLWAEALYRYRAGEAAYLPDDPGWDSGDGDRAAPRCGRRSGECGRKVA